MSNAYCEINCCITHATSKEFWLKHQGNLFIFSQSVATSCRAGLTMCWGPVKNSGEAAFLSAVLLGGIGPLIDEAIGGCTDVLNKDPFPQKPWPPEQSPALNSCTGNV